VTSKTACRSLCPSCMCGVRGENPFYRVS
jgi:hypothetical protein